MPQMKYKKADLLGITLYDFVNNYCIIYDDDLHYIGLACIDDIDKYIATYSDLNTKCFKILSLKEAVDNAQVLSYSFLKEIFDAADPLIREAFK